MRSVKKRSVVVVATVFLLVFLSGFYIISTIYDFEGEFGRYNNDRVTQLAAKTRMSYHLLKHSERDIVIENLEFSHSMGDIDFYRLYKNQKLVAGQGELPDVADFDTNQIVTSRDWSYLQTETDDYRLLMGVHFNWAMFHFFGMRSAYKIVVRDVLVIASVVVLLIAFFFKDLWRVMRALKSGRREDLKNITAYSREASVLLQSLKAMDAVATTKSTENELLKRQLLPALQSEMFSGKSPPYAFYCALVRADVNDFSSILKHHDRDLFLATVNEFFTLASRVISRYQGVVSEFLGDEVIFYFKDEGRHNCCDLALSAVRDLKNIAEEFDRRLLRDRGYGFHIKSAVSYGELVFSKQVDRYTVSGTPLIESVRILSAIESRTVNSTWVSAEVEGKTSLLFELSRLAGEFDLKGIGQVPLYKLNKWSSLQDVLNTDLGLSRFGYFRSDSDYLHLVDRCIAEKDFTKFSKEVVRFFREHPPYGASAELSEAWVLKIKNIYEVHKSGERVDLLSSMIGATRSMIGSGEELDHHSGLIKNLMQHPDPRVVSNTIDLLRLCENESFETAVDQVFKSHPHHRVRTAALLYILLRRLDSRALADLRTMIADPSPLVQASALFAMRTLEGHYNRVDPVVLNSNLEYEFVRAQARKLRRSQNRLVLAQYDQLFKAS